MDSPSIVAIVGIVALVVVFALALNRSFTVRGSREQIEFRTGDSQGNPEESEDN